MTNWLTNQHGDLYSRIACDWNFLKEWHWEFFLQGFMIISDFKRVGMTRMILNLNQIDCWNLISSFSLNSQIRFTVPMPVPNLIRPSVSLVFVSLCLCQFVSLCLCVSLSLSRSLSLSLSLLGFDFDIRTDTQALYGQWYPLPHNHMLKFAVAVNGAGAPKRSMTYDPTQGNFLCFSTSSLLWISESLRGL